MCARVCIYICVCVCVCVCVCTHINVYIGTRAALHSPLCVELWAKGTIKDSLIGSFKVPLRDMVVKTKPVWYPIFRGNAVQLG